MRASIGTHSACVPILAPGMQADQHFGVEVSPWNAGLHLSDKKHKVDADENATVQDDQLMPPRLS